MRALVTGGTGFIGSHLIDELLEQGYDVRVLRRNTSNITLLEDKKLSFEIGDLTDTESLVRACPQVDVVFHIAALPRQKIPRFVFMSSAAVYGFPKTQQPLTEEYRKNPTAKYGESKLCAEGLVWGYGMKHNITVSAIRSPVVTGPRDRLIALFLIKALQQGRLFYIGDGNQKISVSDGRDVAHCLRLAGESQKANGQAYNVKSFDSTPRQLIETLAERLQLPVPEKHRTYSRAYILGCIVEGIWMLQRKENPPFTRHKVKVLGTPRLIDITKATQELNYTPRYTFTNTIDDIISWYLTFIQRVSTETPKSSQ